MSLSGYAIMGALNATRRAQNGAPRAYTHADVFFHPDKVVVSPHNAASMTFTGVMQVAVAGAQGWVPQWAQDDTEYTGPVDVAVRLSDGTVKKYVGVQSVTVTGGAKEQAVMGAAGFNLPALQLDPSLASTLSSPSSQQLTPEQLANLDRALTPEEQKRVDAWQAAQSDAMQKVVESKSFIDPTTGKMTKVSMTFQAGAAKKPWVGLFLVGSVAVIGLGATIYLLAKAKWGWALANFFIITPAATAAVGVGYAALAAKRKA